MELPATPRRLGALLETLVLLVALRAEAAVGRTPGVPSVSEDGQAHYSIPISLPPGTNGLTPTLSIDYGHRTRGGLLGVGWSIGGLSEITRCARTVAQDGVAAAPIRSIADRFCLDGQRLVIVNGAVYEAPNAEYRTEIESFARIRAMAGTSTNGPAYFTVEAADGRIYEYGATNDSRIDGSTGPSTNGARSWALNRIRDRAGNVIDYRYAEESGSTAFRIANIQYNSNPGNGIAASHQVTFTYEQRPNQEIDSGYVAGMPVREVMRLDRIDVLNNGSVLRRYDLAYEPALSSGGRSRLASVKECGAGGTDCLAPTTFEWQDGIAGTSAVNAFSAQVPVQVAIPHEQAWNIADIDGDGRNDILWAAGTDAASLTIRYRLSVADRAFGPAINTGIPCRYGIGVPFDANGDSRADLLMVSPGSTWAIASGGPSGLAAPVDTGIALPAGTRDFRGADLNGDGLGDIAWSEVADPQVSSLKVRARFSKAGGGFGAPVTLYDQWIAKAYSNSEGGDFIGRPGARVDLDGDGAEELLMSENYSIARISDAEYGTDGLDIRLSSAVPLDFNDDGCTDFAYKHTSGRLRVRPGFCSIQGSLNEIQGPAWTGVAELFALDWNGDGRDDILVRGPTNWLVGISLADSVAPLVDTGIPHENAAAIAGRDLDGDGLHDIAVRTANQVRVRYRTGPVPDLLLAARDGFGVIAQFSYRPLTDAIVYIPGSLAAWPDPDTQTNDSVVSTLAVTDGSGEGRMESTRFSYAGLRHNVQGRGTLGFRKFTRTDLTADAPLTTESTRRQDFPFTGLPDAQLVRQASGKTVSATEYRWSKLDLGSAMSLRRFPYPSSTTERRFEMGGPFDGSEIVRTVRSVAAIDATSGQITDETTTTTEMAGGANAGSSSSLHTLHSSIFNDTVNWCLGRTQAIEVTASHTLPGGAAITREADQDWDGPKCRPTRVRLMPGDGNWRVTYNLSYDAFGNIANEKVTGAGMTARSVATNWGPRGQLPVRITDPLSQVSRYEWDESRGLPLGFTDPNGSAMRWEYDALGRMIRETQPDGTGARWTRESCKTCDPRGKYRLRQDDLDVAGIAQVTAWLEVDQHERGFRLETQVPGGGRSVAMIHSGNRGEVIRRDLPHWDGDVPPGYEAFAYDGLGRETDEQLVAADGTVRRATALRYDGLAVTETDGLGRSTTATRSAWGGPNEVVDAAGGRARYEYDAFGALTRVRDAANNTLANIAYSPLGMKVAVTDADLGSWAWTRNPLGETTALRDAKGQVIQFNYDALGRLTRRTAPDGTSNWVWGSTASKKNIGRLASLSGPGYSEAFTYDSIGRPASQTIASDSSYRFDYTYNALGLLDTITYPAAGAGAPFRIRHDYDDGRVSRIGNADAPGEYFWRQNAQDAAGHALDETLGASVRVISGYAPVEGNLEYRQSGAGSGAALQDLAYAWDGAGNLASRRDLNQGLLEEFRYDTLGRLTESRRNGTVNLALDYDAIGNVRRRSDVCGGTAACFAYHATRKHAVISNGTLAYEYDANGNMTSRGGASIAWSSDNRPISIAQVNGNSSAFSYGPEGNRWKQVARNGGTTETTLYASGLFEKTTRGGVTTWRHYVLTPGGVAVQLRSSDGSPPAMRYLTSDHLGSTDKIVDASGNVLAAESFGPFGDRRKPHWAGIPTAADLAKIAAATRDGYTGHEQLDNLGLIHMNGRVYDPQLGRFISADPYATRPYDGQGLNRYAYALNNPLAFTDPGGFDPVPCLATQDGNCVQITVIATSWIEYMRWSGSAHAAAVASAMERDPCGQFGSGLACAMQGSTLISPSSIVLTVGTHADLTLAPAGRLDAAQGFAARMANIAISSSPIAMLFGADPDFQYFREPDSDAGRMGARAGDAGYLIGGFGGALRRAGSEALASPSRIARTLQGKGDYPGIDRFKDIMLKKGKLIYAGFPGQGSFYTTASAIRRAGDSAGALNRGLQIAPHRIRPMRMRYAAYEVIEDTPAAFGLALENARHGTGWLPQIVVPSYETSLRYVGDFPLGP